jgi:hypothetical protein
LNRLEQKFYLDGTAMVRFGYDGYPENGTPLSQMGIASTNPVGRLSHASNMVNATRPSGMTL